MRTGSATLVPLALLIGTLLPGCTGSADAPNRNAAQQTHDQQAKTMKIRMNVEGTPVTATLSGNETSRDFASLLPLTLTLKDYGDVEKISDLPRKLTIAGAPPGSKPSAGDLAYYAPWGNLALFRKDFDYSSGLVLLGKIDSGVEHLNRPGPLNATIEAIVE